MPSVARLTNKKGGVDNAEVLSLLHCQPHPFCFVQSSNSGHSG